jgi:hypothetical protein
MSQFKKKRSISSQANPDSPLGKIYTAMHKGEAQYQAVSNLRFIQKIITIIGFVVFLVCLAFIPYHEIGQLSILFIIFCAIGITALFLIVAATWMLGLNGLFNKVRKDRGMEPERIQDIFSPRSH